MIKRREIVFGTIVCAALAVSISSGTFAAPKAPPAPPAAPAPKDPFVLGQAYYKAGQYAVARRYLLEFVEKSAGDPRIGTAKELLPETWTRQAEALIKNNMEPEAAAVWMDCAAHYKTGAIVDQSTKRATKCLTEAYPLAVKAKDFEKAVACADRYEEFKLDPPLASETELRDLRADWLADGVKRKIDAEILYIRLEKSMKAGVTAEDLHRRQLTVNQIRKAFARSLFDDGYYEKAADLLKTWEAEPEVVAVAPPAEAVPPTEVEPPTEAPPASPATKPAKPPKTAVAKNDPTAGRAATEQKDLSALLTKTLVERANALLGLGNRRMLAEVLAELQAHPATAADANGKAAIGKIQAFLKKTAGVAASDAASPPRILKFPKALTGEGVWVDDGSGNQIEGTIDLGTEKEASNLHVGPGFVLEGGTLYIHKGTLDLQGQPGKPVIFRKVALVQDLGGYLQAKFAVFENCSFNKAGFWYAGYSSKWTMSDCLLLRSNFVHLDGTDFGIQLKGCGFFDCKLPPRQLCPDPPGDAAAIYNDAWNAVEENGFDHCEIAPSFVWSTKRCAFNQCTVTGTDVFHSSTPLEIQMAVNPGSGEFFRQLQVNTSRDAAGFAKYVNAAAKGPIKRRKMPAWKFASK